MKNTKERTLGPNDIKVLKRVIGLKSGKDVAVWINGAKQALAERGNLLRFTELYQGAHVVLDRLSVDGSGERTVGARIKIMEAERVALVEFLNKRGISQKIGDKPAPLVNRIVQFAERQAQAVLAMNNPKAGEYRVQQAFDKEFEVERFIETWEGFWPFRNRVTKWVGLDHRGVPARGYHRVRTYSSDALAHAAIKRFQETKAVRLYARPDVQKALGYQPTESIRTDPPQGGSGVPPPVMAGCRCIGDRQWNSNYTCQRCGGDVRYKVTT